MSTRRAAVEPRLAAATWLAYLDRQQKIGAAFREAWARTPPTREAQRNLIVQFFKALGPIPWYGHSTPRSTLGDCTASGQPALAADSSHWRLARCSYSSSPLDPDCSEDFLTPQQRVDAIAGILAAIALRVAKKSRQGVSDEPAPA